MPDNGLQPFEVLGLLVSRHGKIVSRKAYQDFFSLWKDANPGLPILNEAKAEYSKLK